MTKFLRHCLRYPPVSEEAFAVFVLENPEDEGSVLTKESMDTFWEIHAKILDIEVSLVQHAVWEASLCRNQSRLTRSCMNISKS